MKKERIIKLLTQIINSYLATHIDIAPSQKPLITIRTIDVTPKVDSVKVWISLMLLTPSFDAKAFLEEHIKPHSWAIKKVIAQEMRHLVRQVPKEIVFCLDQTAAKAAKLETLIEKVAQSNPLEEK